MYALTSVFGLGLDSFLACVAIGVHRLSWRERFRLAMAFGACDAAATLIGTVRPHWLPEPPVVAIYLVFILVLGWAARSNRRLLYALPVLLSLDNLFAGAPASAALMLGLGSATMAMLALSFTATCRNVILKPQEGF